MRLARLIILAVVVLALGAYIYFVERHAPTTDEVKERADKVFPPLEQAKVRRIVVIQHPRAASSSQKEKDVWKLVAPLADDANAGAVTSLLGTLDVAEVGAHPQGKRRQAGRLRRSTRPTLTGRASPTTRRVESTLSARRRACRCGTTRAALTGGADTVLVVSKYIATDLEKDLAGWRSDQLVAGVARPTWPRSPSPTPAVRVALAHTRQPLDAHRAGRRPRRPRARRGLALRPRRREIKEFVDTPGSRCASSDSSPAARGHRRPQGRRMPRRSSSTFGIERDVDGAKQIACRRGERVFWVEATARRPRPLRTPPSGARGSSCASTPGSADTLEIEAGAAKASLERKDGDVEGRRRRGRLHDRCQRPPQHPRRPAGDGLRPAQAGTGTALGHGQGRPSPTGAGGGDVLPRHGRRPGRSPWSPGRAGALTVDARQGRRAAGRPAALVRPKPRRADRRPPAPGDRRDARTGDGAAHRRSRSKFADRSGRRPPGSSSGWALVLRTVNCEPRTVSTRSVLGDRHAEAADHLVERRRAARASICGGAPLHAAAAGQRGLDEGAGVLVDRLAQVDALGRDRRCGGPAWRRQHLGRAAGRGRASRPGTARRPRSMTFSSWRTLPGQW